MFLSNTGTNVGDVNTGSAGTGAVINNLPLSRLGTWYIKL